jgi:hypothetical protein
MIVEFLRSGKLGGLDLGLSRSEVRQLLGEEKDHSKRSWKNEIWKYDNLQVTFFEDRLELIGLYLDDGNRILMVPKTLVPDGRIVCEETSVPKVEKRLLNQGLHFAVIEDLTFDDQRVIRIEESGVSVVFFQGELSKILLANTRVI